MNKTTLTIWVTVTEPAIENGKIIIKKGEFYYNKQKYIIENGKIYTYVDDANKIQGE